MVHTQIFVVVVVVVAEMVPCALVVVMLELLGPVKLKLLGSVKQELLVVVKVQLVVVKLEPVAAILEPLVAMLKLVVTGPPVDNLEPVESDVLGLLVKQAVDIVFVPQNGDANALSKRGPPIRSRDVYIVSLVACFP